MSSNTELPAACVPAPRREKQYDTPPPRGGHQGSLKFQTFTAVTAVGAQGTSPAAALGWGSVLIFTMDLPRSRPCLHGTPRATGPGEWSPTAARGKAGLGPTCRAPARLCRVSLAWSSPLLWLLRALRSGAITRGQPRPPAERSVTVSRGNTSCRQIFSLLLTPFGDPVGLTCGHGAGGASQECAVGLAHIPATAQGPLCACNWRGLASLHHKKMWTLVLG